MNKSRQVILDALAGFEELSVLRASPNSSRLVQVLMPWCIQVHRHARAILLLIDDGFGHEARLLMRAAIEYSITMQWVAAVGDSAVEAVISEYQRSSNNIIREAEGGPLELPKTVSDMIYGQVPVFSPEAETLKRFQSICENFGGRDSIYVVYRFESRYVHPSWAAAVSYLCGDIDGGEFSFDPSTPTEPIVSMTACAVVWAGYALDSVLAEHPRQKELIELAKTLDIPECLTLG